MKVRMKVDVSGTRNGQEWPRRGSIVDLPDAEAIQMCEAGMAVPVVDDDVETATLPADEESRPLTTRTGPTKRGKKGDAA